MDGWIDGTPYLNNNCPLTELRRNKFFDCNDFLLAVVLFEGLYVLEY